jgi:glycosyltransferase involved in cell wall biosynthesis
MKILWINPSFLDYRIPVYEHLNKLTNGNFYLVYSKQRIPLRCVKKIEKALGNNALGLRHEKSITIGRKNEFANTYISIPYPKGLYKLISTVTPDIILGEGYFQWTPWAIFRSWKLHVPFLLAYERTAHTERNCPWWRKFYRKWIDHWVDGYLVNGNLAKSYLISTGVDSEKITTGVMSADSFTLSQSVANVSLEEKEKLRKRENLSLGITYLYVGRLIELKGIKYLLKAWSEHILAYPEDNLLIVGDGPLYESLFTTYSHIAGIHFAGLVDYDKIYQYYAIADIFVIPTLEDNWSLVVPEAMACGLPVACSIYNGCYPELVHENENGILFDPLKEETILKALAYFHSADISQMGIKSIEIESNYIPDKAAKRIYEACALAIKS